MSNSSVPRHGLTPQEIIVGALARIACYPTVAPDANGLMRCEWCGAEVEGRAGKRPQVEHLSTCPIVVARDALARARQAQAEAARGTLLPPPREQSAGCGVALDFGGFRCGERSPRGATAQCDACLRRRFDSLVALYNAGEVGQSSTPATREFYRALPEPAAPTAPIESAPSCGNCRGQGVVPEPDAVMSAPLALRGRVWLPHRSCPTCSGSGKVRG